MVYNNIYYIVSVGCIKVPNSFKIYDDEEKMSLIKHLLYKYPELSKHRTAKSMLNEWKVHNALYQREYKVEHTKDVDFEFKQKWYLRFVYWLASKVLKEHRVFYDDDVN